MAARKKRRKSRSEANGWGDELLDPSLETTPTRVYRENRRGHLVPVTYRYQPKNEEDRKLRKEEFLRVFAATGSVTQAVVAIGSYRSSVYDWKRQDPDFAAAWNDIWQTKIDDLEQSAMERATHGYDRPVYQQGKLVGVEKVHVPQLSMFMLSKARPERYGDTIIPTITPSEYARMIREATRAQDEEAARAASAKE